MKKVVSILVAASLLFSLITGCNQGKPEGSGTDTKPATTVEGDIVNNTFKQGYPIVKDKINLRVVLVAGPQYGDYNKMTYWSKMEELTNIHLNFEVFTQNTKEKMNLLFASQDFPDILCNGQTDAQVIGAAEAGQIVPLNDLISKYSPNWVKFFEKFPYAKKISTVSDGKIYSLPIIRMEPPNTGIRDQWMIHVGWLNELGLSMPKTTDDFYKVLKAFKDNAGKGTIPKDVIPWYFRYNVYANGGQYELYNAFGVFTPGNPNYISVDEKQKVVFSAADPKIKEPIRYLNKLYKEGLIPPEAFSDDNKAMDAKTLSKPPICGSYLRYYNDDPTEKVYDVLPPLQGPGGSKPMFRQQSNSVIRNYWTIFKNNKYPEASMRLANTIAEPDWSIQGMYGMYGEWLEKASDGKIIQKPFVGNETYQNIPGNSIPLMLTEEIMKNFQYDGSMGQRAKNVEKVYKPYVVPLERYFPSVAWTNDQNTKIQTMTTDLVGYVDTTLARWIVNGGIDQEWDAYISKMKTLKLDEYIKTYQEALDTFNRN